MANHHRGSSRRNRRRQVPRRHDFDGRVDTRGPARAHSRLVHAGESRNHVVLAGAERNRGQYLEEHRRRGDMAGSSNWVLLAFSAQCSVHEQERHRARRNRQVHLQQRQCRDRAEHRLPTTPTGTGTTPRHQRRSTLRAAPPRSVQMRRSMFRRASGWCFSPLTVPAFGGTSSLRSFSRATAPLRRPGSGCAATISFSCKRHEIDGGLATACRSRL